MNKEIPSQQAPGLFRRKVGSTVVTLLNDGSETFSFDILSKNIKADEARNLLAAANLPATPSMPVNVYLVQNGKQNILIDSGDANCTGTGGRLHDALAAANIKPSDIDTILLTHAHSDHIGSLAAANALPLFPNAELVLHEKEYHFWQSGEILNRRPHLHAERDLACNAFDAYRSSVRTVTEGEVVSGITIRFLPGHTPGHSGYFVESGSDAVLIWGDIVHWPDIQIPRPDVTSSFDIDPDQMVETRRNLLAELASDDVLVGGMHLNFPGFIRVKRDRQTFMIREERWMPDLN
jgi:glyoxylase-like metal-dependent hydrolase (beta-lactamase superfamily II)